LNDYTTHIIVVEHRAKHILAVPPSYFEIYLVLSDFLPRFIRLISVPFIFSSPEFYSVNQNDIFKKKIIYMSSSHLGSAVGRRAGLLGWSGHHFSAFLSTVQALMLVKKRLNLDRAKINAALQASSLKYLDSQS